MDREKYLRIEKEECFNAIRMMEFFMRRFDTHFQLLKELYGTYEQTQPSSGDGGCNQE